MWGDNMVIVDIVFVCSIYSYGGRGLNNLAIELKVFRWYKGNWKVYIVGASYVICLFCYYREGGGEVKKIKGMG